MKLESLDLLALGLSARLPTWGFEAQKALNVSDERHFRLQTIGSGALAAHEVALRVARAAQECCSVDPSATHG